MNIEVCKAEANEEITVIKLSGRLDTATVEAEGPKFVAAVERSEGGIIVDLDGVDFIGSAGLRAILSARKKAESEGKPFVVIRAKPAIYKIFKIAMLDEVFEFFEDETDALRALRR